MNTPPITAIDTALAIYYKYPEIGNSHIKALFGKHSSATINRLKQLVNAEMMSRGVHSYTAHYVNTEIAYSVWGLDVSDLEKRRAKLKKLGL
ncbi:MAG: hypothetical protein E7518_00515 [Ruminococcaceae bacterium]|nr:hypothetical protein [Oscillospiraceae bacterium]